MVTFGSQVFWSVIPMSKCLVLFVEGDTEVEFYKQVIANARKLHPTGRFDTNIEYRNVKGVGGFKSIALRKYLSLLLSHQ